MFVVGALYAAYRGALAIAPEYLYSSFIQPIAFNEDVFSGKLDMGTPRVLLLGDSTAGMNYAADKLPQTLSLAMFASSVVENYYSLRRYLEKHPNPACLVISASYASKYQLRYGFWETYVFHGFYPWSDLAEIYREGAAAGEFAGGILGRAAFFGKTFLYRAHLAGIHLFPSKGSLFETAGENYRENVGSRTQLRERRGTLLLNFWSYEHDSESLAHLHEPFAPSPLNDRYLQRILDLAASRSIPVHWLQPPVSERFLDAAVRSHYASLSAHLAPLVLAHPGNTFNGAPLPFPDSLMVNPVHLNSAGVERFQKTILPLFQNCR